MHSHNRTIPKDGVPGKSRSTQIQRIFHGSVCEKDIFSRRVTGDWRIERQRGKVYKQQAGKDYVSRTRRLEEFYIFQLEVVTIVNDDIF